jgi:hypothetical protein
MLRPVGPLRLSLSVLALSACVIGSPSIAHAETSDRDRAAARAAADAGADAYDQQRYTDAVELFGRAEKLVHATPHLLFIARSLVKLGRLVEAHETYLKIQRDKLPPNAPNAFKRAQAEAEKEIADVAQRLSYATVRIDGAPSDAVQVTMDNAELPAAVIGIEFPVDPGTHVFRAQAGTDKGDPVSVRFEEGAHHGVALKIALSEKPAAGGADDANDGERSAKDQGHSDVAPSAHPASSKGLLIAGSIVTGLGVIGSGIGIYFVASSASHRGRGDDLHASCDPTPAGCSEVQRDYIYRQDQLADADRKNAVYALVPAGALVVTGVTLLVVHASTSSSSARATPPRTTLVGGTNWVGISTRF